MAESHIPTYRLTVLPTGDRVPRKPIGRFARGAAADWALQEREGKSKPESNNWSLTAASVFPNRGGLTLVTVSGSTSELLARQLKLPVPTTTIPCEPESSRKKK